MLTVNLRVEITPSVEDRVMQMAGQSADGRETGGILLGCGPDAAGLIRVEEAGDPGSGAKREPGFFLRDLDHAQQLAAAAWVRSKSIWVGEWHTHPHGDPRPSPTDLSTYAGLLRTAGLEFEAFVSLIAIPDPDRGWDRPPLYSWVLAVSDGSLGAPESSAAGEARR
jgi:integrative and conjugative element protein (TIGR02256 family)